MASENTRYAREGRLSEWLAAARHVHFVGICGAGMRSLARCCLLNGYTVTGSDDAPHGEGGLSLSLCGIPVSPSGSGGSIAADLVVYSVAVEKNHPELVAARERGIPTVSRADLLGALLSPYPERIGIAGTHGKSTVTAKLLVTLLRNAVAKSTISPQRSEVPSATR